MQCWDVSKVDKCPKCGLPMRKATLDDIADALVNKTSLAGWCFKTDDNKCLRAQLADEKQARERAERERDYAWTHAAVLMAAAEANMHTHTVTRVRGDYEDWSEALAESAEARDD